MIKKLFRRQIKEVEKAKEDAIKSIENTKSTYISSYYQLESWLTSEKILDDLVERLKRKQL